jgi:sensor histidine kinase YesM
VNKNSLKFRLLVFIIWIIAVMTFINIIFIFNTKSFEVKYSDMIGEMVTINEISQDMSLSEQYFERYFTTNAASDLGNCKNYSLEALAKTTSLNSSLDKDSERILLNLENVVESYRASVEETLDKFHNSDRNNEFYPYFEETKKIYDYSNEYVKRLQESYLKYNKQQYDILKKDTSINWLIVISLIVLLTISCVIFTIIFSNQITMPLKKLVSHSHRVSQGKFERAELNKSDIYEIDTLTEDYNHMVEAINKLVAKIKEKAKVEKQLKDQEVKNLLMENMLKESQLKMLQAQINPHFLFNTLNTVVQTAMLEDAFETEKLINSVADMLRYSMIMVESQSTVEKEINNIRQYIYIQEVRFKDRVKFKLEIDESLGNVSLPGMILQPLVENAFMHGIEGKEEGGNIGISVSRVENTCLIVIVDDGVGIPEEKVKALLSGENVSGSRSHRTGIGFSNVIKRLRTIFNREDVLTIDSKINFGTKMCIRIPIE